MWDWEWSTKIYNLSDSIQTTTFILNRIKARFMDLNAKRVRENNRLIDKPPTTEKRG